MKFKKGRNRIVLVLPLLGIAVKLPIVHFFTVTASLAKRIVHLDFKIIRILMRVSPDCDGFIGYRNLLFGGTLTNWREFLFFYKTKNPFLQPTYFSLFGLINIQKLGQLCTMEQRTFQSQLRDVTNDGVGWDDHHFINPDNFCFSNGKLRILDYGSKITQETVILYGAKIQSSFNPN